MSMFEHAADAYEDQKQRAKRERELRAALLLCYEQLSLWVADEDRQSPEDKAALDAAQAALYPEGLDTYYLTDQPETCPKCGSRTEFDETVTGNDRFDNPIVEQYHKCLNPACGYEYDAVSPEHDE